MLENVQLALSIVLPLWVALLVVDALGAWTNHRRVQRGRGALDSGSQRLLGRSAEVVAVRPTPKVRVGGEIWDAEAHDNRSLTVGNVAPVRDVSGMKLIV